MKNLVTLTTIAVCIMLLNASVMGQITYTNTTSGSWSTMVWSPAGSPTATDNVVIADGFTVTIDQAVSIANLTVGQGASGILTFDGVAARAVVVSGNLTVSAGGTFITQAAGTFTNTLSIGGDLTNNGTLDMSRNGSTFVCNVTFSKVGDQTISGSGTLTRFRGVTLNKVGVGNRVVASADVTMAGSQLFIFTNGTWEQTAGTLSETSGSQTIAATGALIISGTGNLNMAINGSIAVNGTLTVNTSGTFIMGAGANSVTTVGTPTINFTAGTVTIIGRLTLTLGNTTINGATILIDQQATNNLAATSNAFECSSTGNLTFTSGSVTIVDPNGLGDDTRTGRDIKLTSTGTMNLAGSSFYLGDGVSTTPTFGTGTGFLIGANANTISNLVLRTGGIAGRNVLLKQDLTVSGVLTRTSGTFAAGGSALTLGPASTLLYNGTTSQTTGLELPASLNSLTVNNPAGVTLGGTVTVTGTLTLSSGLLTLGAQNLTLSASSTISGASSSSYIVAEGTGTVNKTFTADGSFAFPVGDNTGTPEYSPVTLNFTGGAYSSASASVRVTNAKHTSNTSLADYLTRYWTVTQSGITGFSCVATFSYIPADVVGTEAGIDLGQWNGSTWADLGATNPVTHTLSGTVSSFSDFTGGEPGALPIQLASFVGSAIGGHAVRLDWTTLSEINNFGFYVQRRLSTEQQFTELPSSFVPGHGTTLIPQQYTFTDNTAGVGHWFYRLKQLDLDGTSTITDPIEVDVLTGVKETAPREFVLNQNYPNPFNPSTEIKFSVEQNAMTTLKVYNILGQEVVALFNGIAEAGQYYSVRVDATSLPSGMYFYTLESGQRKDIRKMLLLK